MVDRKFSATYAPEMDPFHPDNPFVYSEYADLYLLGLDESNVWMADLEADVGNGVYVETLKRWSAISHGVFSPTDIVEKWESDEGPVTIEFDLNGGKHAITAENYNDFIDIAIIGQLNRLISDSGYEFVSVVIDQEAVVVCITKEQKKQIETDRGLRFFP